LFHKDENKFGNKKINIEFWIKYIPRMKLIYDAEGFAKKIKQKRIIELDIDTRTLGLKLNISAATISRCENGRMPELLTYAKLCKWVGVPMNQFIKTGK
jgi:DNA-binding XRE family transcriptional regulator